MNEAHGESHMPDPAHSAHVKTRMGPRAMTRRLARPHSTFEARGGPSTPAGPTPDDEADDTWQGR